jgi:hypothetical protein
VNSPSLAAVSDCSVPWWARISTLWLLLVPVCTALYTLLLPIGPNDFWYHARAGAEIVASGKIPKEALFSASVSPHTPYFYQSWLAEIALFQTLQVGGLSAIIVLRTVLLTFSFGLLQWCAWRRVQRIAPKSSTTHLARCVALSTLLVFALCASNMDVRPQIFSVPLFGLFTFVLYEWGFLAPKRREHLITVTAALMMLWANTHGAFVTGLVLLCVFIVGEILFRCVWRAAKWFGTPLAPAALGGAVFLFFVCAMATLANMRGLGIYTYVFQLAQLKAGQRFIQEWQAPSVNEWYGILFFMALILMAALLGILALRVKAAPSTGEKDAPLGAFGVRFSELLVLAVLAVMALRDVRSIIWFALFAAPIITALLCRCFSERPQETVASVPRPMQIVNAFLAVVLIVSFVPFLPHFKSALPLPPEYSRHFAPTPQGRFPLGFDSDPPLLLERNTPVEAVAFLRKSPPPGKLWNDFVFGSYLVWATIDNPRLAPHADPRVEMHPLEFWEEYGRIAEGAPDAAQILDSQGFSDALLDVKEQPELAKRLQQAGWRVVFPSSTPREGALLLRRRLAVRANSPRDVEE